MGYLDLISNSVARTTEAFRSTVTEKPLIEKAAQIYNLCSFYSGMNFRSILALDF
jgi:hypothetical protein